VYNVNADVMHCHDWQTAPVAWGDKGRARSVFTIHNLNYGSDLVGRAMAACDVATTVSPTYAREVSEALGGVCGGDAGCVAVRK
jgi:starch synthase